MRKCGEDILVNDAAYRRWLKRHHIDRSVMNPTEYPCIVECTYDSYGDYPTPKFRTIKDLGVEHTRIRELIDHLLDLQAKAIR